jgi:hypothetical protein
MQDATEPLQGDSERVSLRPLRIAFVTETYPPEVNGVAMTLAALVRRLQARHHQIELIRPRQDHEKADHQLQSTDGSAALDGRPAIREVLVRGMRIPRYSQLRMGLPAKDVLLRAWLTQRPDVVHIATEGPLGWSALQAARALKLPVSTDFRTNFHAYSGHYGMRWLNRSSSRTFANFTTSLTEPRFRPRP